VQAEIEAGDDIKLAVHPEGLYTLLPEEDEHDHASAIDQGSTLYRHVVVFAELSLSDHEHVVKALQKRGSVVAMCGDLVQNAAVTICAQDSATSAFTTFVSTDSPVKYVADVLLEGRACAASTIALFQFIVLYGVLFSFAKMTGFYFKVFMSNSAYLYIDLLIFLPTLVTITMSKPALDLVVEKPPVQLRNSTTALSLLGSLTINLLMGVVAIEVMQASSSYVAWPLGPDCSVTSAQLQAEEGTALDHWWELSRNWEASVIFLMFANQLLSSSLVFQFGHAFRDSFYTNISFMVFYLIGQLLLHYIILAESNDFTSLFVATGAYSADDEGSGVWDAYYNATLTQDGVGEAREAMPFWFRGLLSGIMLTNTVLLILFDQMIYRIIVPRKLQLFRYGLAQD